MTDIIWINDYPTPIKRLSNGEVSPQLKRTELPSASFRMLEPYPITENVFYDIWTAAPIQFDAPPEWIENGRLLADWFKKI